MKFALLTAIAAGAALVQVGASPLRVVVVTSTTNQGLPSNFRFGHAVSSSNINNPNVATLVRPAIHERKHRGSCLCARLRQKSVEVSNAFRKALGWPLIETTTFGAKILPPPPTRVHILPFIGTPNSFVEDGRVKPHPDAVPNPYIAHPHPHHKHGKHVKHMHVHRVKGTQFMHRLHIALMTLGPWEGRAVAFVLGCGIGVLMRMLWVLAVVSYRLFKGPKEDEQKYTQFFVVEEYEDAAAAEGAASPPPTYTFPDEKADKKDGEGVAPAAN